tara:strand:- start:539 stop:2146 length:1608 start_codon:yes stop_codon:yes gene_type:complete
MHKFNLKLIKYLCLLLFLNSCAYFNSFYNTENIYKRAEDLRRKSEEKEDLLYLKEYQKALEKAEKLIREYPESRFVLDATFIKAKSLFYLGELNQSRIIFSDIISNDKRQLKDESLYWLSLIKWKNLQPVIAIKELEELFILTTDKDLKSRIALSLGEIYISINNYSKAYDFLNRGIDLTSDRLIKEKIYFSIANSSFEKGDYDVSLSNYQNFLSLSSKKSKIYESNLRIIEIFRRSKKFDMASIKVKELLLDENFDDIKANLELELIKIEIDRNKISYAIDNLDRIGQEYRGDLIAAEANFMLSNIYLMQEYQDFEKAKFFLNEIISQEVQSEFKYFAERNKYNLTKLIKYSNEIDRGVKVDKNLFRTGEILSFRLNKEDAGKYYFKKIIDYHNEGNYYLRSLFSMYLLEDVAIERNKYKSIILTDFSNSDFAKYIIDKEGLIVVHHPSEALKKAELVMKEKYSSSISLYKDVLKVDNSNESSKVAAYFLGQYYDYEISEIDSAKYYYDFLVNKYPFSQQAIIAKKRLEAMDVK